MALFRKKPVVIEAVQFVGHNVAEVSTFMDSSPVYGNKGADEWLLIETLEGTMRADKNDWIIRGVKGELYPCKPDIFTATYDEVGLPDEVDTAT